MVEEKEGESDEGRWRERDTRGGSKGRDREGDHNGSLELNNKPNKTPELSFRWWWWGGV